MTSESRIKSLENEIRDLRMARNTRPATARPASKQGGLLPGSLLSTMTSDELAVAAHDRMNYNRQRAQLKNHMQLSARFSGTDYMTRDELGLAAKLAGMENVLTDQRLNGFFSARDSPRGAVKDGMVNWRFVNKALAPTEVQRPEAPATAAYRAKREKVEAAQRAKAEAIRAAAAAQIKAVQEAAAPPPKKDPFENIDPLELQRFHKLIADKFKTRFSEVRKGFRILDQDQSGMLSRKEMKAVVHMFNLSVPDRILEAFVELADYDGSDAVKYDEFARIMTADDILEMKDTLMAQEEGWQKDWKSGIESGTKANKGRTINLKGKLGKLDKPKGPRKDPFIGIDRAELKKAHDQLREHFTTRFAEVRRGFQILDTDKSGFLSRDEMRKVIALFNLQVKPELVDVFIDLADYDQSDSIAYAEFARLMLAENILALKDTLTAQEESWQKDWKSGVITGTKAFEGNIVGVREMTAAQSGKANAERMAMAHFIAPPNVPVSGTGGLDFGTGPLVRKGPPKLRHGVKPFDVRNTQRVLTKAMRTNHSSLEEAFMVADSDLSGVLERAEVLQLMKTFVPYVRDQVLENLVDFVDQDGDGQVVLKEFVKCLEAEDILSVNRKPPKYS